MPASLLARTAQMTAAVISAVLLTAFVTVLPVPAHAERGAVRIVVTPR